MKLERILRSGFKKLGMSSEMVGLWEDGGGFFIRISTGMNQAKQGIHVDVNKICFDFVTQFLLSLCPIILFP